MVERRDKQAEQNNNNFWDKIKKILASMGIVWVLVANSPDINEKVEDLKNIDKDITALKISAETRKFLTTLLTLWGWEVEAAEVGEDYWEKEFKTVKELKWFLRKYIYDTPNRVIIYIPKNSYKEWMFNKKFRIKWIQVLNVTEIEDKIILEVVGKKRIKSDEFTKKLIRDKEKRIRDKEKRIRDKEKRIRYKEDIYLKPSFEIDKMIFELLNDEYKNKFNIYLKILQEGLDKWDEKKIEEGSNGILSIAWEVMNRIKKWDKWVYDVKLIDNKETNNEIDIKYVKNTLNELINFYSKIDVFKDSARTPWLVNKWKEKIKNKLVLLWVIVENLNIEESQKKEIKKLINILWETINSKPIVNWS